MLTARLSIRKKSAYESIGPMITFNSTQCLFGDEMNNEDSNVA